MFSHGLFFILFCHRFDADIVDVGGNVEDTGHFPTEIHVRYVQIFIFAVAHAALRLYFFQRLFEHGNDIILKRVSHADRNGAVEVLGAVYAADRKSTRLNSSHSI